MAQPKWLYPERRWENTVPKNHIQIIKGKGEIKQIKRTNSSHEYISISQTPLTVKENTWYFPGWNLLINNQPAKLSYTKDETPGLMTFTIPPGLHKIQLLYQDLPDLIAAKTVTVLSIGSSLFFLLFIFLKKIFKKRISRKQNLLVIPKKRKKKR